MNKGIDSNEAKIIILFNSPPNPASAGSAQRPTGGSSIDINEAIIEDLISMQKPINYLISFHKKLFLDIYLVR
jgi:hypothetical protein